MNREYSVLMEKLKNVCIRLLRKFKVTLIDEEIIKKVLNISVNYRYSYWDSLIIASAIEGGCSILYTEDMQDEQVIEGKLKIVNPFERK